MNRIQLVVLLLAALLFAALYWGFDTKPASGKVLERSRALQAEATGPDQLVASSVAGLSPDSLLQFEAYDQQLQAAAGDAQKAEALKNLAAFWYRNGSLAVSGLMAEQVAALENSDAAWSVAGATFFEALSAESEPARRQFCAKRAVKAFESAASLNTERVEHKVNIALVYAEQPPADNPMQAVLMLRDLEQQHPDAPSVYNALGRLAIKTQQWERAIQRLEKAYSLDSRNRFTLCLLAKAYEGAGQAEKAAVFTKRCNEGS